MSARLRFCLLIVLPLVAAGALAWTLTGEEGAPAYHGSPAPEGVGLPTFRLVDYTGEVVSNTELAGQAVAITFLDTQCKKSCPLIAGHISRAIDLLDSQERGRVAIVAISSDPTGDTPKSVRAFLRLHQAEGKMRYLLGSERQLRPIWDAFQILPSLDTGVDDLHSAPVRIFDRDGVWVATQHPGVDLSPENLAHDLRLALGED